MTESPEILSAATGGATEIRERTKEVIETSPASLGTLREEIGSEWLHKEERSPWLEESSENQAAYYAFINMKALETQHHTKLNEATKEFFTFGPDKQENRPDRAKTHWYLDQYKMLEKNNENLYNAILYQTIEEYNLNPKNVDGETLENDGTVCAEAFTGKTEFLRQTILEFCKTYASDPGSDKIGTFDTQELSEFMPKVQELYDELISGEGVEFIRQVEEIFEKLDTNEKLESDETIDTPKEKYDLLAEYLFDTFEADQPHYLHIVGNIVFLEPAQKINLLKALVDVDKETSPQLMHDLLVKGAITLTQYLDFYETKYVEGGEFESIYDDIMNGKYRQYRKEARDNMKRDLPQSRKINALEIFTRTPSKGLALLIGVPVTAVGMFLNVLANKNLLSSGDFGTFLKNPSLWGHTAGFIGFLEYGTSDAGGVGQGWVAKKYAKLGGQGLREYMRDQTRQTLYEDLVFNYQGIETYLRGNFMVVHEYIEEKMIEVKELRSEREAQEEAIKTVTDKKEKKALKSDMESYKDYENIWKLIEEDMAKKADAPKFIKQMRENPMDGLSWQETMKQTIDIYLMAQMAVSERDQKIEELPLTTQDEYTEFIDSIISQTHE